MLTDLEKNAIRDHYQNIGKNLPGFRPRASQREMIAAVANAFSRTLAREEGGEPPKREGESIAVIEGPTGVGKSLAYLLAGGIMAQTRGKRLIVSSATVALQEQLVDRDLPFLVEKSGLELSFALAKGRGRYLCPYKLYQLTQSNAQQNLLGFEAPAVLWDSKPKPEELKLLRDIADEFSARRFNGDRDAWPEKIDDAIWLKVTNDRHGCLKTACPNRPECPFYLARDVLETVDVVVANHDLLLADISMGGGVILPAPENSFYCIDEAHHLPKKALSRFAAEHSWNIAVWTLEKLPQLTGKIAALTDKAELANLADEAAASLLDSLHEWQFHLAEEPSLSMGPSENDRRTNSEPTWLWEDGKIPEGLETTVSNTAIAARSLLKHVVGLNDALSAARREKEQDGALLDRLTGEFGIFIVRIEQISAVWDLLSTVPLEGEEPLAKWITRRADDKNDYIFNASPISSASHLANSLWRRAAGAVLTSATLQSLGNFNLMLRQTGLQWLPETTTLALKSPFDFEKQGELYIPPHIRQPQRPRSPHRRRHRMAAQAYFAHRSHRHARLVFLAQTNAGCRPAPARRLPAALARTRRITQSRPPAKTPPGHRRRQSQHHLRTRQLRRRTRPARHRLRASHHRQTSLRHARQPHRKNPKPLDRTARRQPLHRNHRPRSRHQTHPGRRPPHPHRTRLRPRNHPRQPHQNTAVRPTIIGRPAAV